METYVLRKNVSSLNSVFALLPVLYLFSRNLSPFYIFINDAFFLKQFFLIIGLVSTDFQTSWTAVSLQLLSEFQLSVASNNLTKI